MLTDQQHAYFNAFGFLHLNQVFSTEEIATFTQEADRLWTEDAEHHPNQTHQSISPFIEGNTLLSQLAVDDRIYGVIEDLLGPDFVWGNSEGNKGSFNEHQSHQWHCDRVGEYDLQYVRLKVMIYLTPTTREEGALRVMPGSHQAPLHQAMVPLNAQGENTSEAVFGMPGSDLPGYALESKPGDVVFFNHYLFHAVYGKAPERRYIALKFADLPKEDAHFEALHRHHQGAGCLHQAFVESDHPRIQHMVSPLL